MPAFFYDTPNHKVGEIHVTDEGNNTFEVSGVGHWIYVSVENGAGEYTQARFTHYEWEQIIDRIGRR